MFERWRGGILTIGTFGYDPLKDENEQINDVSNYLYEEEDELEKEQVLSAEYGSDDDDEITDSGEEVESDDDDEAEEERPNLVCAGWDCEGLMELKMEDINSNRRREEFGFEYVMMEKKERTTLADLFYADSEDRDLMMMKKQPIKKGEIIKHKSHGLFFGKKLIVHDSPRPIRKLHQVSLDFLNFTSSTLHHQFPQSSNLVVLPLLLHVSINTCNGPMLQS